MDSERNDLLAEPHHIACPDELLGIARQLERLESDAARAALVGAIYQAMSSALLIQQPPDRAPADEGLPPLTLEQRSVLDYIRENGVASAETLAGHAGYAASTIKRWCGPNGGLRAHGVKSTAKGYALSA